MTMDSFTGRAGTVPEVTGEGIELGGKWEGWKVYSPSGATNESGWRGELGAGSIE